MLRSPFCLFKFLFSPIPIDLLAFYPLFPHSTVTILSRNCCILVQTQYYCNRR